MKGRTVRRLQRLELTESPAWCTARSTEGLFVGTVGTVGTDGREGRLVALPPARQMTVHVQKVLIRSESRSTAAVQLCVAVQVVARLHLNLMQSYCSDTIVSHDDRDHLCYHVVGRAHLGPHHCPHPLRGPPRRAPASPSRQVHSRPPSCRAGVLRRKNDWPRPTQWVVVTVPQYCRCSL